MRVVADELDRAALDALGAADHLVAVVDVGVLGPVTSPMTQAVCRGLEHRGRPRRPGRPGSIGDEADPHVEGALEVGARAPGRGAPTVEKTGGGVQVERSSRACTAGGRTRARLAARPPPVTWESAWTSTPSVRMRSSRSAA